MDDCGQSMRLYCIAGGMRRDGKLFKQWRDVWVGDVGLGIGDPFVVEEDSGSEGVGRPGL